MIEISHATSRASSKTDFHIVVLPPLPAGKAASTTIGSCSNTDINSLSKACSLFVLSLLQNFDAARKLRERHERFPRRPGK
jgi:hypothetical protein